MSEIISSFYSPDQNPRHAYDFYPAAQTNAPLVILIHGDSNKVVPCAQSERMQAALSQRRVTSQLILAPGLDHAVPEFFGEETYLKVTADFLKACFDGAAC